MKSQKKKLESTAFIEELPISHWYQKPVMFGKEMTYCCTAKVAGADGMWATFPITNLPRSQNRKHKGTPVQMVLRTLIQLLPGHLQILRALHSIWHAKRYEIRPLTQMRCQITVIYFLFPHTQTKSYKLHMPTNTSNILKHYSPSNEWWQRLIFKFNCLFMLPGMLFGSVCLSCSTAWPVGSFTMSGCSKELWKEMLRAPANATKASTRCLGLPV